jgi:hypothetical protein
LLTALFTLLAAHRPACRQERTFARLCALTLGHLLCLGRHTLSQTIIALGLGHLDWSAHYRLFSVPRLAEGWLGRVLVGETLPELPPDTPYRVLLDSVLISRASWRLPGTGWALALWTPPFKRGLQRAQRFVHLAWLTPRSGLGYARAVPLRFVPAYPAKARPATAPPVKEWVAGLAQLSWLRQTLDALGELSRPILAVADASWSCAGAWASLPARVTLVARCARNRALYALPGPASGRRGRPRQYGARALRPDGWLAVKRGWRRLRVVVRGRSIPLTYRVEGPYLVRGASACPLFLLVVRGVGAVPGRHRRRAPAFWLVNAAADGQGGWQRPDPVAELLADAWQRWEIEITHRELKSGFGVGEVQCWNPTSASLAVQWQVWVYAVLVLVGYRVWGLGPGTVQPLGRWWTGPRRWSVGQVQQALRQEVWGEPQFHPPHLPTAPSWEKFEGWLLANLQPWLVARRL